MPNKRKRSKGKKATAKKIRPKRRAARKTAASSQSSLARRKMKFSLKRKRVTSMGLGVETVSFSSEEPRKRQGGQSGDLQGLSYSPTANSESVDELLEEGNALEAAAVLGVERAPEADQGQVRTQEVPEDDVPAEYLDKDQ
jgi:hypothetical protein